ncbi:hypothetical protein SAY86_003885 [Trapa natans]|uniref:Uncharacterized protein n=1 Tax=Trapa natans TaxID=22666 RepID=A0AAN7N562_TRANT|nr:hypothetical protein SAY86_003885 [Trapa natans]
MSTMHPRHRSPGNGYRSNSMGMSMSSRISPENSGRGHGFYNLEYRSFNRNYGRSQSQPKHFHPSPSPPLSQPLGKSDVFIEAGKLAAEYLVSRGILPPGALTSKWQNGNLKDLQEYKSHDTNAGYNIQFPVDGRASGPFRLQDSGSDPGPVRRRHSDGYGSSEFRNYAKGKKRGGPFRGYKSERGRDYGRNSSWSDRSKDANREYDLGNHEEQLVAQNNNTLVKKSSKEILKGDERGGAQEPESKEHESRVTSYGAEKNIRDETDGGDGPLNKREERRDSKETIKIEEDKDVIGEQTNKEMISEELPDNKSSEKRLVTDLQNLCKFANMPTKTRSLRGSRLSKEDTISDVGTSHVSDVLIEDKAVDVSVNNLSGTRDLEFENSKVEVAENINLVDRSLVLEGNCELNEKRGEKRLFEENNTNEDCKRVKEWLPSGVSDVVDGPSIEDKLLTVDYHHQQSTKCSPQTSQIGKGSYAQEKQLFPSSFKICDLNLMEASDVNETHDKDPIFMYPPISDFKKEVDIDLSISNSSMTSQHAKRVNDIHREIEVIDLDEDSTPEDRGFDIIERKPDITFTSLDGYSTNPVQNPTDIPDSQDGYGLMISELLATEFAGCPSVPEMNPLDNMDLNSGAGPLGDDDSIYMSLGEIPFLSFMHNWEHPPSQEDGKPF